MKKIKVCFIAPDAYSLFNPDIKVIFSGADVQLYLLANSLVEDKNHEISFVVNDFNQEDIENYNQIKVYKFKLPTKKRMFIFNFIEFLRLFKILRKINADIYIQRSADVLTGQVSLFTKIYRKKFIFMAAHEKDCDLNYSKLARNFGEYFYIFGIYRYLFGLKTADLVITQNKEQENLLKESIGVKSLIIKSAYPISELYQGKRDYILWIARCIPWKQPEIFLELAKLFPKEKFVMVAPGKSNFSNKIKNEARKIKNITLINEVPFCDTDEYFKKAKIIINTSIYEGFANTFVQATKNGVPIISLNTNPDNFIINYKLGFVSGNLGNMAKDLKTILKNKKLYNVMAKNAYNYAKENHDINKIKNSYKKLFEDLLKNKFI